MPEKAVTWPWGFASLGCHSVPVQCMCAVAVQRSGALSVGREQLRQEAEDAAAKRQLEAQDSLKRAHAESAARRAKATAAAKARAA